MSKSAGFAKENLDALIAASAIAQNGTAAIVNEIVNYNQTIIAAALANMKSLLGFNSYQDIVEKQSAFARGHVDVAVAGATKVSELAIKVATECAEPIEARLRAAQSFGFGPLRVRRWAVGSDTPGVESLGLSDAT